MHDLGPLLLLREILLIDGLDSHMFAREFVHSQVDLSKRSSAEHLACSIKVWCGRRCIFLLLECFLDRCCEPKHLLHSRRVLRLISAVFKHTLLIVPTESDVLGNLLCRYLSNPERFLRDVDRVLQFSPVLLLGVVCEDGVVSH